MFWLTVVVIVVLVILIRLSSRIPFHLQWLSLVFFIVASITLGLSIAIPIHLRWVCTIALFIGFSIVLGQQVTGQSKDQKFSAGPMLGILIDNRFKMSLSRFQIVLWTILVFSALAIIALDRAVPLLPDLSNIFKPNVASYDPAKFSQALNIIFPEQLLIVLGISSTSLAAASLIKSNKTETQSNKTIILLDDQRKAVEKRIEETTKLEQNIKDLTDKLNEQKAIGESDGEYSSAQLEILRIEKDLLPAANKAWESAQPVLKEAQKELDQITKAQDGAKGDIHTNDLVEQAEWSDMFRGELVSNYRVVDVAKVQMFYLTILLIFIYGTAIWGLLAQEQVWQVAAAVELPAFSDTMVGLLGISHAGYLAVKQTSS